jgi:V/A-type H+/Na+-transporting ATPase subunit K
MDYNMAGPALALGLSAIGSSIGCGIAGMASHAVMSRVDEGHGRYIAMAAMPSSQIIYGFALMFLMSRAILDGSVSPMDGVAIGFSSGSAIMVSAILQGKAAATGIQATAKQPAIYGKCFAALGIIESFALFAFVFAYMLM